MLCRMSCFDRANDVPPKSGDLGYSTRRATRQDATPGQNGARERSGVTYEEPRMANHGSGTQVALPMLTVGFSGRCGKRANVSSISRRGMVQFGGNTYRIIKRDTVHEIVRVLDDCVVGSFRREPAFEIVQCLVDREVVLAIARLALHTGRLSYQPKLDPARGQVDDWLESFHWNDLPSVALLLGAAHLLVT